MIQHIVLKFNSRKIKRFTSQFFGWGRKLNRIYSRKSDGFTLIELLVVVSIIGLLASVVVVSLGGARTKGRDARAKADIRQIQTALELCYNETTPGAYPDFTGSTVATPWVDISGGPTSIICGDGDTTFMSPVPTGNGSINYQWNDFDDTQKYGLRADLEDSGCFTITEVGITETATGGC